jgi:hypothetical protein
MLLRGKTAARTIVTGFTGFCGKFEPNRPFLPEIARFWRG